MHGVETHGLKECFLLETNLVVNHRKETLKRYNPWPLSCSLLPTLVGQRRSGRPVSSLKPRVEKVRPIPTIFHHQKCFHILVAGVIVGITHHALRLFIREVEFDKMDGKILVVIFIRKGIISRAQAEDARPRRLLSLSTSKGRAGTGRGGAVAASVQTCGSTRNLFLLRRHIL